jgi:hypothetical protein
MLPLNRQGAVPTDEVTQPHSAYDSVHATAQSHTSLDLERTQIAQGVSLHLLSEKKRVYALH